MTAADASSGSATPLEPMAEHAVERIVAAAGGLWPGQRVVLLEHVPSVTSYVHRVRVGRCDLYAKYSVLGASLVSVVRGQHGEWNTVLAEQQRYLERPGGVLEREAEQLRRFAEQRSLRTCPLAGYAAGVLFTVAATEGVPLDGLLLAEPHQAARLLRRAWTPVTRLHTMPLNGWPVMPERDIVATFTRKFIGQQRPIQPGYVRRPMDPDVVEGLRFVVRRLRGFPATHATTALVYGELKPEHVIMTADAEPVFLDPGVHVATPGADLAKFVARVLLLVLGRVQPTDARRHIVAGLTDLIRDQRSTVPLAESRAWMTDLLTLIVRDLVNILSTYLAAPAAMTLPHTAAAVLDRIGVLVPVLEQASTWLVQRSEPVDVWEHMIGRVVQS